MGGLTFASFLRRRQATPGENAPPRRAAPAALRAALALILFSALGSAPAPALAQQGANGQSPAPAAQGSSAPRQTPPAGAASPATNPTSESQLKSRYGEWDLRCDTPPGARREQCALLQSVAADDKPNISLVVIVLKTADGKNRLLRTIAPLGVLLPNGLGLKIDDADIGRAGFVRCVPSGCVAEVIMEDKLIEQMRTGKTATFIIYQTPEEGVGIPLSLKGFAQGFDALP